MNAKGAVLISAGVFALFMFMGGAHPSGKFASGYMTQIDDVLLKNDQQRAMVLAGNLLRDGFPKTAEALASWAQSNAPGWATTTQFTAEYVRTVARGELMR